MEAGEIVTVNGVKYTIRRIAAPLSYCPPSDPRPDLLAVLDRVAPKPDIRWERIPDYVTHLSIEPSGLRGERVLVFYNRNYKGDDWAFPNWRDFIGKTFERPKGGEA